MPQFPNAGPFNQQAPLVFASSGVATPDQARWLLGLAGQVAAIQTIVNNNFGTNFLPLASQPSLGAGDVGYVMYVTDYAHLVYWDGAAWQWLDGDRPGRFDGFAFDPGAGWGLCDGSTYTYLIVGGATLTTGSLTTANQAGSPSYLKSGATYTGTLVSASAPGASASLSGNTGDTSTTLSGNTDAESATQTVQVGVGATVPASPHFHGTSGIVVVSHHHSAGTLAASVTVDATADPRHLVTLPYVRL